jgi:hypothetical protein
VSGDPGGLLPDELSRLLGPLSHPCDLDLLLFFHRHPRALVTSERLAAFVGHDVKRVGRSLDTLMEAGALQRSPHPAHEARLYVLRGAADEAWLAAVLAAASSDEGRTALMRALKVRASDPNLEASRAAPPSVPRHAVRDTEEERHA